MDSESSLAFGIAGQQPPTTGRFLTADAGKFGPEFRVVPTAAGARRRDARARRHPCLADGDGR